MPQRASISADLTTATLAASVFAALGIAARDDVLVDINDRVRALVQRADSRTRRTARLITLLSESGVHPVVGWLASKEASNLIGRATYAPLMASLTEFLLNKGSRLFVHQERPPGAKPRRGLNARAYPSGHTFAATAIAFATALEIADGRSRPQRVLLFSAAAAYAGMIGWTRLVLDEHWIDDVVGAWAAGIALAILVHHGHRAVRGAKPRIRKRRIAQPQPQPQNA